MTSNTNTNSNSNDIGAAHLIALESPTTTTTTSNPFQETTSAPGSGAASTGKAKKKKKSWIKDPVYWKIVGFSFLVWTIFMVLNTALLLAGLALNGQHTTYTRWGSSTCPTSATLVYSGITGGHRFDTNGGSNFQCMPNTGIEYSLIYQNGIQGYNVMYGTEYSTFTSSNGHNVPCAVCLVQGKTTSLMIPAKTSCPDGWKREFYGYLMAQRQINLSSTFECVDASMEVYPGTHRAANIARLTHVEASCDGLPCAPYSESKELNCVVCTM